MDKNIKIGVIGLGYVGLPLSIEFSKHFKTKGLDINVSRLQELRNFNDTTLEVENKILKDIINPTMDNNRDGLFLTDNFEQIKDCNIYNNSANPY